MEIRRLTTPPASVLRRAVPATLGFALVVLGGCAGLPRKKTFPAHPPETALRQASRSITQPLIDAGKRRIAVVNFADMSGETTAFGAYIAENLTAKLVATKRFDVMERTLLAQLLSEHQFVLSGLVEPAAAQTLGRFLGADAIISGTYTVLDGHIQVHARVIDTETGTILAAASVDIARDPSTDALLSEGQPRGRARTPTTDTPPRQTTSDLSKILVFTGDRAVGETGPSAEGGIEIKGIGGKALLSAWGKDTRDNPMPVNPTWSTNVPEVLEITPTVGPKVTLRALRTTSQSIELYVEQDGIKRTFTVFIGE